MNDVITIVSVPHTGTHSVIELFRNKGYNEIGLNKFAEGAIKLNETKINLVYGHMYEVNIQTIKNLNKISQIIVPIRDPLLSLISNYERRKPQNTDKKIAKTKKRQLLCWILWANEIFKLNPFHVPVDLDVSHLKYGDVYFKNIGIYNTKGNYPLKQAYRNGDLFYIKSKLDLRDLVKMEYLLRPPLEQLGYKDLLWWK